MQAIDDIAESDPDLAPIDDKGAKVSLKQIALTLQNVVKSIVTIL